jgi:hypothetical protein
MPIVQLDPSLINAGGGVNAFQNAFTNALKMRASQQELDDNQYKIDALKQDRTQQNAIAEMLADPKFDPRTPQGQAQMYGAGGVKNTQSYLKGMADLAKTDSETAKHAVEAKKISAEVVDKKSANFQNLLNTVQTPQQAAQWLKGAYSDPDLAPMLGSVSTYEEAVSRIGQDPQSFATWKQQAGLTASKLADVLHQQVVAAETSRHNLSNETETSKNNIDLSKDRRLTREQADRHYNFTREDAQNAPQYMETDAGLVALPKRPIAGQAPVGTPVMAANGQPLGKPLKDIPVSVNSALVQNQQSTGAIDRALSLLNGKDVNGMTGDKEATGLKGYLPNGILNRIDPQGVSTRAEISDIGSLKIHDRSGAAVTLSEAPRLMPFIPLATDDAETVKKKLERLKVELVNESNAMHQIYNKEQGYKTSPLQAGKATSSQDSAAMNWAKANPNDPRAAKILQHLGQ